MGNPGTTTINQLAAAPAQAEHQQSLTKTLDDLMAAVSGDRITLMNPFQLT